jgi:hypothetical protein
MAEDIEYIKKYEQEQKKVSVLEQRLSLYQKDATFGGYYALNNIVNQQVKILNEFELNKEISLNPKEDKKYDRVKSIWEDLSKMITALNSLKTELKISGNEEKDSKDVPLIEQFAEKRS